VCKNSPSLEPIRHREKLGEVERKLTVVLVKPEGRWRSPMSSAESQEPRCRRPLSMPIDTTNSSASPLWAGRAAPWLESPVAVRPWLKGQD
jgi:hypothetical protein